MPQRKEKASFLSPLQRFIKENCNKCSFYKRDYCSLTDHCSMRRMELCILLYCHSPPDVTQILKEATAALQTTEETAEATLEDVETDD
jgi:hypothetical protein